MDQLTSGAAYENAFLIFVDAAGYSTIVAGNPRDRATRGFDLLHHKIASRLAHIADRNRAQFACVWHWAGDGGLIVVHDDEESIARDVTLEFLRSLLTLDLPHLRDEFAQLGVAGRLSLRLAAHRGVLRYRGPEFRDLLHSPDLHFAAHLQKAAPPDTAAVFEDVVRVAGPDADRFEPVGTFEGRGVYLLAHDVRPAAVWLASRGLSGAVPVRAYVERPSQFEKARMIRAAASEVIDLGTSVRTSSRYLVTTERPAHFRDAVLTFLERGGTFRIVLMNPRSEATALLSRQRGEDLVGKTTEALGCLRTFKSRHGNVTDRLEVLQTDDYPGMACLAIDLDEPHALMLTSPYLMAPASSGTPLERGDMPHYTISRASGSLFESQRQLVRAFATSNVERVL